MNAAKTFSIIITFLLCSATQAQTDFSPEAWHYIDTSIQKKKNLADVLELVRNLREKADQQKEYFIVGRCYDYELKIADIRTEDTLWFKNSAFIDSLLLNDPLPAQLKWCMQVMQAKRLSEFAHRYNRFERSRYQRKDIPINYALYSNKELDSISNLYFDIAKQLSATLVLENVEKALWVSSDPLQFLFKPHLYDIAITEQINCAGNTSNFAPSYFKKKINDYLNLSQDDFIQAIHLLSDSTQKVLPVLALYSNWLEHNKDNNAVKYFVESLARKFAYNYAKNENLETGQVYERYLQQILISAYSPVRAHAVYQLCILWNSQSKKYFPSEREEYDYRTGAYTSKGYDSAYRYHSLKALQLFEANKNLLDSFQYLRDILSGMERQIKLTEMSVVVDGNSPPGKPILAEIKFKNTDSLYYRIVRVGNDRYFSAKSRTERILDMLSKNPVKDRVVKLPEARDYNYHATYLTLDALAEGSYALLFSYRPFADTASSIEYVYFDATNIAVVNNDQRVYVLHRQTGMPLTGAKVKATYYKKDKNGRRLQDGKISKNYTVNTRGYITITDERYDDLEVYYKNDTTFESVSFQGYEKPDDVYDKEEYDNIIEYYGDNAKAHIFTDRSIYRPGQTVYYKALFLTKNRKTGEPIVMSKRNLKGRLFGNVYKRWMKEEDSWLYVYDAFNKETDSIKIVPNEFGSVSGSFKIPKTASTGEWSIEPDYIDTDYGTGTFKVEEYKRPSYEITIDKPKKELLPGDIFSFKVKVRSFAGAQLNNVRINYAITRNGRLPVANVSDEDILYQQNTLVDTVGYTNSGGELEIFVNDSLLRAIELNQKEKYDFNYSISAEAIDATGESYEDEASVSVSTRPIAINIPASSRYNRSEIQPLLITTSDKNAGVVSKKVSVKVFRIEKEEKLFRDRKLMEADVWLHDKTYLQNLFPDLNILHNEIKETRILLLDTIINTGEKEKLSLSPALFVAGNYQIETEVTEKGFVRGDASKSFTVFDEKENKLPRPTWSFHHLPYNSVMAGDTLKYYYGNSEKEMYSIFHIAYYEGKKKVTVRYYYDESLKAKGLHRYDIKVPANSVDMLKLTQVYVFNNQLFKNEETVYINKAPDIEPEIIVEKYRKKLSPGAKETFIVSVKTKNENVAAELMTTMYDASLDKLEEHKWEKPENDQRRNSYINLHWTGSINSKVIGNSYGLYFFDETKLIRPGQSSRPLWWVNPLDYYDADVMGDWTVTDLIRKLPGVQTDAHPNMRFGSGDQNAFGLLSMNSYGYYDLQSSLVGRVAGLSLVNTDGLDEVVVIGYGVSKKSSMTGSVSSIRIRGQSSLAAYSMPLIILDGIVYEGDLSKIDPSIITAGLILKGADASAIYGARAANGVLVLSTKGEIVFPEEPEPEIIPRKNFSESAFFFPAIYADKNGYYTFSFTMPESVTEWNWKMLAHTTKAQFAYAEKKLNTQLPLMVQPNMPRLLYQGDRIVLQNRISNLDTNDASGNISCKIEDAITGEDITGNLLTRNQDIFTVSKRSNISSAFEIKVPATQLHPIKVTVSIRSENFVDGEEHIIPILSPKVFVKESKPFVFNSSDTSVLLPSINADAEIYGIGLAINPKPQAALINSLPYLANYPFDCAEQTFNKLLAYLTARRIMQIDSAARLSFEKAKGFVESEDNSADRLPDDLAEESMPWLNMVNNTSLQQKQLFNVLDTSKTEVVINELLQRLYKLQNTDGGISWFGGGKSDFYISCYLLKGFGLLQKNNQLKIPDVFEVTFQTFIGSLIKYCDENYSPIAKEKIADYNSFYLYARGYWLKKYPIADSARLVIKGQLEKAWEKVNDASLYTQSLLIIATLQYEGENGTLYKKAEVQLKSIRQLAIEDEQNGLRWKSVADSDDLNNSSEEIVVLLAEAFEAGGMNVNKEIIKWLMTAKNEHHWGTTKATAAVINVLAKENKSVLGASQSITTKTGDTVLSVTDDLMRGSLLAFTSTKTLPPSLHLNKNVAMPATGNISWYYFTPSGNLSNLNKDVSITKKIYRWNDRTNSWTVFNEMEVLKIADKVKVVLTVESSKPLSYVYIDDKRASTFEPIDNTSGYEYAGFGYCKSVRDVGFQFFADFIPSGKHEISYELKVAHEGDFNSGPPVLQCMYKPEVNAYGNAIRIVSEK